MKTLVFEKMQGAGNDFIMVDNRNSVVADDRKSELTAKLCRRAISVGADGMIFLEDDPEFDARWDFYNSDGSSAEMCGNGARCFAVFANSLGVFDREFEFRTIAGTIKAEVTAPSIAKIKLTDAPLPEKVPGLSFSGISKDVYSINTGVPHVVVPVGNIDDVDIQRYGAEIRYHERFAPAGTNVNFISFSDDSVYIRTYERGVESETLACGTGAVAAAIVASEEYGINQGGIAVVPRSGDRLRISYSLSVDGVADIYLEGSAVRVYRGEVEC